jgi:serine/threonine-protein kinase
MLATNPNARSIDYLALERGTGVGKHDHRSDIYFAGCMFYHMLTGIPPLYETRDRLQRMSVTRFQEIKDVGELDPSLPMQVVACVNRSMAYMPDERYQEPGEMLADLKKTRIILDKADQEPSEAPRKSGGQAAKRRVTTDKEGEGLAIMLVESQLEMQNLLRDQLKKRGYRVLITSDPARAIERFEDDVHAADCVVFSSQELGGNAVAAFNEMGRSESIGHIPAVLMVDQRHTNFIESAETNAHRVLLPMPLKIRDLRQTLLRLLAAKARA